MRRIKLNNNEAEIRYTNWVKAFIDLVKPTNLFLIGGRGLAKSTEILAERSLDVIYEMPRAPFAFVSDTYVNLMTNIIPSILMGWERKKFFEGVHYVVDRPPLPHWKLPLLVKTFEYKHTISTFNGCKFFLKSLDRPSSNAGISVVHHFGDEAKYMKKDKLNKLFPTLRGDSIFFASSPYFMGQTYCSDMPDPSVGEDDWLLDMEKNMDKEMIIRILQAAIVVNEIRAEFYAAQKEGASDRELKNIQLKLSRWEERHRAIRYNSTLFYCVSSFANADILTLNYFKNMLETLGIEEFKTAILSMHRKLVPGQMFYGNLSGEHFYYDGYNYDYYDQFSLKDNPSNSCRGLKHLLPDQALEAGFDAGNMMSLVIGQEQPGVMRVLKNIHTLSPEWIRELADKFIEYFKDHRTKNLHLWCDRAAYQYRKTKKDFATTLKHSIEYNLEGKRTGWTVTLMNIGQANITHADEFDLMNVMMGGKTKALPKILIDAYECKELKSSLELAKVRKNSKGEIEKVKTSEKLEISRLPMQSTNYSDAFKYLICRPKFMAAVKHKRSGFTGSVSIRG